MPRELEMFPDDGTGGGNGQSYFLDISLSAQYQMHTWNATSDLPAAVPFKMYITSGQYNSPEVEFWINFSGNVAPWLTLTGSSVSGSKILISNYGAKTLQPVIGSIANLPDGDYTAEIFFTAYDGGNWSDQDSHIVYLSIFNGQASAISFSKKRFEVYYNRQSGALTGETAIGITNNAGLALTFEAPYFKTKNVEGGSVTLEPSTLASDPAVPVSGVVQVPAALKKSSGETVATSVINLTVIQSDELVVWPSGFEFSVPKNNNAVPASILSVTNPANKHFTIEASPWVIVSLTEGNETVAMSVSIDNKMLPVGQHTGEVVINYEGKKIAIPVKAEVYSFISFTPGNNNFCLDVPDVVFKKMNYAARFVRLTITAKFSVMKKDETVETVYIVPYVDDVGTFGLGEKMHRQSPRYQKHLFGTANADFMKAIRVDIVAEEVDEFYNSIMQDSLNGIVLFPGSRPAAFPLLTNYRHRRVVSHSLLMNSKIEGDTVKFSTNKDPEVALYDFPKTFDNIAVQWENQNLVPEWFTFTGEYKITSEYNHVYAKSIYTALNQKFDTTKTRTLAVSTGFMLRRELELISEMICSRLVFMKIGGKIYRAFSTTQKMIDLDTADEIVARDVEFLIVEQ